MAVKADKEVPIFLALGRVQLSYSLWAGGIVMVKKKPVSLAFAVTSEG